MFGREPKACGKCIDSARQRNVVRLRSTPLAGLLSLTGSAEVGVALGGLVASGAPCVGSGTLSHAFARPAEIGVGLLALVGGRVVGLLALVGGRVVGLLALVGGRVVGLLARVGSSGVGRRGP